MTCHNFVEATRPYWPAILGLVIYPAATALINWALWFNSPEKWAAFGRRHPKWKFAIKVFRSLHPHLRPVLVAWRSLAQAKSTLPPPPPNSQ